MSTYVRTIHTTMNPVDTVAAAERIADALRAEGKTVTVGPVHDDVTLRWYGMPAVDLTISEADPPAAPSEEPSPLGDDTPEPMPVAEFGGSAPVVEEDAPKALPTDSEASPTPPASSEEPAPSSSPASAETSPAASVDSSGRSSTTETGPLDSVPASTGPDTSTPPSTEPPSPTTSSETAEAEGESAPADTEGNTEEDIPEDETADDPVNTADTATSEGTAGRIPKKTKKGRRGR